MRRAICLLLVFTLFTVPLRANLGETIQQCVARYGRPNGFSEAGPRTPFGTLVFIAGGFVLTVFVYDTKEVGARVTKSDKSAFSDGDLQTIMGADTAGSAWATTKSDDPTCRAWNRADGATVLYDQDKHIVIFTSPAMSAAMKNFTPQPAPPASSTSNTATTNPAPAN
jgi:hypothetical protein